MYRTRLSEHRASKAPAPQPLGRAPSTVDAYVASAFKGAVHRGRRRAPSTLIRVYYSTRAPQLAEREREREIQHSRESERDTALELRNSDKSRERARLEAGRRAVGKLLLQLVLRPYRSVLRQAASPARPAASLRASGDSEHLVHVMHVGASSARSVRPGPCS
jgi:hypothetical protein